MMKITLAICLALLTQDAGVKQTYYADRNLSYFVATLKGSDEKGQMRRWEIGASHEGKQYQGEFAGFVAVELLKPIGRRSYNALLQISLNTKEVFSEPVMVMTFRMDAETQKLSALLPSPAFLALCQTANAEIKLDGISVKLTKEQLAPLKELAGKLQVK